VDTENGFQYFFHKKKKITAWTCPPEIKKEVDELDGVLGVAPPAPEPESVAEPSNPPGLPDKAAAADKAGDKKVAEKSEGESDGEEEEAAPKEEPRSSKAEREQKKVEEQKASKDKQALLNFKQLLLEKGVQKFDKYEKWLPKLLHDPRFMAVKGQSERKALFAACVKRIDADRQKQEAEKRKGGRDVFKALLKKAVEKGVFKDRVGPQAVKAMEKEFGEDERWRGVADKERSKLILEAAEEDAKKRAKARHEAKSGFRALCLEKLKGYDRDAPPWHRIEKSLRGDPRWEPMECTADRERVYREVLREMDEKRKQKVKRISNEKRDVEMARKKRRVSAAEEDLLIFLAERVKAPYDTEWEEVLEQLGNTPQLKQCPLDEEEQERIFQDYTLRMIEERCKDFVLTLTNLPGNVVSPELSFEEVCERTFVGQAANTFKGMPEEQMREAWVQWREQTSQRALEDCEKWLRSCEALRGCENLNPTGSAFAHLIQTLDESDVRFRRLGNRKEEREQLVVNRLKEMREERERGREDMEAEIG